MIIRKANRIFTANSRVYFTTKDGKVKVVRMSPRNVAHLVADFTKKMRSIFKEEFSFSFGGESIEYSGFKIKVDGDKDFTLDFSVN